MSEDEQIRTAIHGVITSAFANEDPAIEAHVYRWNALSHQLSEWPGLFRLADEAGVHGWVIKEQRQEAQRKNAVLDRISVIYDIWGFYKFRTGDEGDNSDDEFSRIRELVYDALKAEPRLALECVDRHELVQWMFITTIDCGEETLHFAQGRLSVHLCC